MHETFKGISLIGMMGSGKSTVARVLADVMEWEMVDLDALIVERLRLSIADIFKTYGESGFRQYESQYLSDLVMTALSSGPSSMVLSTGGGVVLSEENRRLIRSHFYTVWLDGTDETLYARCQDQERPLASRGWDDFQRRSHERRSLYEGMANLHIDGEHFTPEEIAQRIMHWWKGEGRTSHGR